MIKQLYPITDPFLMPGKQLLEKAEACLVAGCQWLQYRNKSSDRDQRLREAELLNRLCERYRANLIINDDFELAATVHAAGVHLGQDDGSVKNARAALGNDAIIGVTCHASLDFARAANDAGANYLAFGRFFPSRTKPNAPPAPPDLLRDARREFSQPLVAIGGINRDNAADLLQAGASSLAVCHELFSRSSGKEIEACVQDYQDLFSEYLNAK